MSKKNDVLYEIDGIPIRAYNKVSNLWPERDYVKLVKTALAFGVSVSSLIRIMASPCQICGNDKVTIDLNNIPQKIGLNGRKITDFHKNSNNG